jgi:PAS domain S-box-containing protein
VTVWFVLVCAMGELAVVQVIANWVIKRAEDQALASAKEHQKVEAAHRESEEKFAMVFQTSPDAIVISDLETGEIMEANPGYERLFGFSRAEIIGRTSIEIGVFDDSDDRLPMVAALRAGRGLRDWEMNARNRKGVMIPLLFSGDVMQLGDRTCLVAVIHDMTDRKAAEIREREVRDEFTRKLLLSQETERRRIAGELHDSLGQNLILLKNRAQLAQDAGGTPPQVRKQFEDLKDLVSQSIAEVRQISHDLRPHQLDQLGLTLALQAMIDGAAQSSRLKVDRKLDPVDDLFTPEDATHLYRAAQETFSNILKHSQARNARVSLERDVHSVRLWIEDDGQGFAASPSKSGLPTGGLGLSSIAERVRIIGGHLQIKSVPGTGTRVEITIPQAAET